MQDINPYYIRTNIFLIDFLCKVAQIIMFMKKCGYSHMIIYRYKYRCCIILIKSLCSLIYCYANYRNFICYMFNVDESLV